ncbi:esterase/lipase family protein [Tomitella biformata]|uniref:esterase/lipase family protein n=1 Tax=Tomitella biformata TaxID=630403 RepID=UPI0004B52A18|nr:alpha/beta fold hydrolase [Tomitella biformata]
MADDLPSIAGPTSRTAAEAKTVGMGDNSLAPPGANKADCQPTIEHPNPVVLVHGSDSTAYLDWAGLSPRLRERGLCVFALNYGQVEGVGNAQIPIAESSAQLAAVVGQVLDQTGAENVDLVGFSQGAAVTRYYVNILGGDEHVDKWVGLASPTYGGTFYGVGAAVAAEPRGSALIGAALGPALPELIVGSEFLTRLNAGGDTGRGVDYTTISTRYDEMIQPYQNQLLRGPGATNLVIQDQCPANLIGHMSLPYDAFTQDLIIQTLDPSAPEPVCQQVPLGTGMLELMIVSNS